MVVVDVSVKSVVVVSFKARAQTSAKLAETVPRATATEAKVENLMVTKCYNWNIKERTR